MKKSQRQKHTLFVAIIFGICTFVALSLFSNGLVEIARSGSLLSWAGEVATYMFLNRLGSKVIAAVAVGFTAGFVADMVAYGKAIKAQHRHKTTHVHFANTEDSDNSRIA